MPKFNVYFMSPMVSWAGIEAKNKEEAINQCEVDSRLDAAEGPFQYYAEEIEEEEIPS